MKTLLISLLALALVGAGAMTRPARRDFLLYLLDQRVARTASWTQADIDSADKLAKSVTFRNRFLWTTVEKDGKVVYVGALSHWFAWGQGLEAPSRSAGELAKFAKTARAHLQ